MIHEIVEKHIRNAIEMALTHGVLMENRHQHQLLADKLLDEILEHNLKEKECQRIGVAA